MRSKPTWRAILPELVPNDELAAASALNGIEFNLARAIGPGLAGLVIAAAGVATAFVANFVSFFGVILVVARWKRPVEKRSTPPEGLGEATVAAFRYVRNSPAILTVLVRTGFVMFFSSPLFALLPTVARRVNESAIGYGVLLGCFGSGAIAGALVMQRASARWSTERIVSTGVIILGVVITAMSVSHRLSTLSLVMFTGGAAWVTFISLISARAQRLAAEWVRARALAIFILVYQGSFAIGSACWGAVAQRYGLRAALVCAGCGTLASVALALFAKLPDSPANLTPWVHWRLPLVREEVGLSLHSGPVLVTTSYRVIPGHEVEFTKLMHQYARIRRRDGGYQWALFRDTEFPERYSEIFLVRSWAEHLRQHARQTEGDRELEQRILQCLVAAPEVRHLIHE